MAEVVAMYMVMMGGVFDGGVIYLMEENHMTDT